MNRIKTAVILAAGKGIRLDRPDRPKPLVRIGHKPLIQWTAERLERSGIERLLVVVGHRGDLIRRELLGQGYLKIPVEFIAQDNASDAGMLQSIMSLEGRIDEPFLVTVADVLSEDDPYRWVRTLEVGDDDVYTVVATENEHLGRSGANSRVVLDVRGNVETLGRTLERYDGLEVGVYYFGSRALAHFRSLLGERVPEIRYFDELLNTHARGYLLGALALGSGEWYDINTPATAVRAELFLREKMRARAAISVGAGVELAELPASSARFSREKRMESEVFIRRGILSEADRIAIIPVSRRHSPHFLLTDTTVEPLYADQLLEKFRRGGFEVRKLVMPAGEHAKSIETYLALIERIFAYGLDEDSVLVNIGGGVVNNMAGALAATIYRGIGLIHIPTTTMAQFDAAIDFKQAVNHARGKNLIGAYHPAFRIVIDPATLETLPERHVRNGLAEPLKHALAQRHDFYDFFMAYDGAVRNSKFVEEVARRTVELKLPLLSGSTDDEHNEMAPQYGHSVGHALEHLSGYELLHGEAVAIGCCVHAEVARLIGVADDATVEEHYALFRKYGLPTTVPEGIAASDVSDAIRYDKHYLGKLPRLSVVERVGSLWHDKGVYAIPVDYPVLERAIVENKNRSIV